MIIEALVRYTHFLSIFAIIASVFGQWWLLKPQLQVKDIRLMAKLDTIYGIGAITAVGAGMVLWFVVGKPADFYTNNWLFHFKVGLAILLGLLSIHPTIFLYRNKKKEANKKIIIPSSVLWVVRIEMILLFIIPLCATIMARGLGL
jgi:putative membrane protein